MYCPSLVIFTGSKIIILLNDTNGDIKGALKWNWTGLQGGPQHDSMRELKRAYGDNFKGDGNIESIYLEEEKSEPCPVGACLNTYNPSKIRKVL